MARFFYLNKFMNPHPRTVLIIDHDASSFALLWEMLHPLGVTILHAISGREGLRIALQERPDLIVLDLVLPDVSGTELCAHIRQRQELLDIPVVLTTTADEAQTQAEAIEAGCIGLLLKPLKKILVQAMVKNALSIKALLDANRALIAQRRSLSILIVHDMRNLIEANRGFAKLALEGGVPFESEELLRLIEQTAGELSLLTNSLLDVEKLESPEVPVRLEPIDLIELAMQRVELTRFNVRKIGVRLIRPKAVNEIWGWGDLGLTTRIFDNLIFNAIKFSPARGVVDVSFIQEESGWHVAVTNGGAAIPNELQARIFEKFTQLNLKNEEGQHGVGLGLGLGLAFCDMAVTAMEGTIRLESPLPHEREGVRFLFSLKAATKENLK